MKIPPQLKLVHVNMHIKNLAVSNLHYFFNDTFSKCWANTIIVCTWRFLSVQMCILLCYNILKILLQSNLCSGTLWYWKCSKSIVFLKYQTHLSNVPPLTKFWLKIWNWKCIFYQFYIALVFVLRDALKKKVHIEGNCPNLS